MPAMILSLLTSLLPDVLKRVLPAEKMSDEERAKLQTEITLALMNQDWQRVEAEYRDRDSARSLAAQEIAKGNALTSFLAAVVRPLWGLGAFGLVAWGVYQNVPIPDQLKDIIQTVLWFYFGGRTVEKITPTIVAAATGAAGKAGK